MIIGLLILVVSVGVVILEAADKSQQCFDYFKSRYSNVDLFKACYDGCVHN